MKAAVIGSGISGLTAGALLAKEGCSVTVFEQNENIGGVTATFEKDGYRWDWGQMLIPDLGPGEPAGKILEKLGISDRVKTVLSYRETSYPDFQIKRPAEYKGIYWRKELLKTIFPADSHGLDRYYKIYDRILDLSALMNKPGLLSKIKLFIKFLPFINKKNWSAQKFMDFCFSDKKLQAVFTGILADYVISPEDFAGLIIPMINAESEYDERVPLDYGSHQHRSSWAFIINGCIELVNALANIILENKGLIKTGLAVKKIGICDNRAYSITTADGKEENYDAIIASGGARELFLKLIGMEYLPQNYKQTYLDNISVTESVFMVHIGVDYDPSVYQNGAALRYYYLTYDVHEGIEKCKKGIYHEGSDGFLVFIPSIHSPEMAPPSHHAVSIYTIAPNNPVNGNWENNKEEWAQKLLNYAEKYIPDLRKHIKTMVIITPEDLKRRTFLDHHAFGGCTPNLHVAPPPHDTPFKNLWFIGAQSKTFGGVANAMIGAGNAVRMILEK